jgi:hypothetical protein
MRRDSGSSSFLPKRRPFIAGDPPPGSFFSLSEPPFVSELGLSASTFPYYK